MFTGRARLIICPVSRKRDDGVKSGEVCPIHIEGRQTLEEPRLSRWDVRRIQKNCYGISRRSSETDIAARRLRMYFHIPQTYGSMVSLAYKGHSIIAAAKRDPLRKYKPTIHISWTASDGKRAVHSFTLPNSCSTFDEASERALQAAKLWVDRHFNNLH
jgi:hypothetical protein